MRRKRQTGVSTMAFLFWLLIAYLIGSSTGWTRAHKTVANECKLMGRFHAGAEVFHCTRVEHAHPDKPTADEYGLPEVSDVPPMPPVKPPRGLDEGR